jgi:hypothetical protein
LAGVKSVCEPFCGKGNPVIGMRARGLIVHASDIAQRSLGDQRKAAAPVVAVAREQAHALAVTLDEQVVIIVFDLDLAQQVPWPLGLECKVQSRIWVCVNISDDAKIPNQANKSAQ